MADWKIRGQGLRAELLICGGCRRILLDNGLEGRTPPLAMAILVALGRAERPPLHAYLQHPEWRKIWMHLLDLGGLRPSDEFQALRLMEPLEEEFMERGRQLVSQAAPTSSGVSEHTELPSELRRIVDTQGVPEDIVRRKFLSYSLVLRAKDQNTGWNIDIDEHAEQVGALTEKEIQRAWTDLDQAIINRVKVALVTERHVAALTSDAVDAGVPKQSDTSSQKEWTPGTVPDPFPEEIEVVGDDSGLRIPSVSLEDAVNSSEYQRLVKTALAGAATLLVKEIQHRTGGSLALPAMRGCAMEMVLEAYGTSRIHSEDTRGFYAGGLAVLDEHWDEWSNPAEQIAEEFG